MNYTPRVAAVHDLSGLGRCSLTVVLPVLSAMGAQCCPLPTAVLSAHTAFPHPELGSFRDLTEEMGQTIRHWAALEPGFDAIYSGFLGSARQIGLLSQFISDVRTKKTLVLVDPVMGDHGRAYRTYTPEMCAMVREMAERADLITPNLTEAALLLGEPYSQVPVTQTGMEQWLRRLSREGARSVVLTGVSLTSGTVGAGCFDAATGKVCFAMAAQEAGQFSGTGDLFAAVTLGALLRGEALDGAVARAVEFTRMCVAQTLAAGTPVLDGVRFEGLLKELM